MTETAAVRWEPARGRDPSAPRSFALWFGVLGPPLAWAAHLVLGDLIFELGCGPAVRGGPILSLTLEAWAIIQTVAAAAVTIAAGLVAYRAWRTLRRAADGPRWDRAHAFAVAGMASALVYLVLIGYGFLVTVFLRTCAPSP